MKKTAILILVSVLFWAACGGGKKDAESETNDSDGDTAEGESPDYDEDTQEEELKCTGLSVDWKTFKKAYSVTFEAEANMGDPALDDKLMITFREDESGRPGFMPGTYDLGAYPNSNYSSCIECVRLFQDYSENGYKKTFFQKSGTLKIESDLYQNIAGTISAKFVEVTIDPDTDVSTVVDGGECYEIESGSFDSGLCKPDCTGKVCGSNGCGGTCGPGCGKEEYCNAEQTGCLPYENCTKITLAEEYEYFDYNYDYDTTYTPNTGDPEIEDVFHIDIRIPIPPENSETQYSVSEFDLYGSDYGESDIRVLVYEDRWADSAKTYFQQKGRIAFRTKEDLISHDIEVTATIEDLRLVESEIDSFYPSAVPVVGGSCLELNDTTIGYTIEN
ncbi:hypothetical protein J5690_03750 [bacterium]|nr:hypothetical protein [bacterium]